MQPFPIVFCMLKHRKGLGTMLHTLFLFSLILNLTRKTKKVLNCHQTLSLLQKQGLGTTLGIWQLLRVAKLSILYTHITLLPFRIWQCVHIRLALSPVSLIFLATMYACIVKRSGRLGTKLHSLLFATNSWSLVEILAQPLPSWCSHRVYIYKAVIWILNPWWCHTFSNWRALCSNAIGWREGAIWHSFSSWLQVQLPIRISNHAYNVINLKSVCMVETGKINTPLERVLALSPGMIGYWPSWNFPKEH